MPGFKNVMFGGEGLFVTTLTGPGTVWLQGMPPERMISEIARRVPSGMGLGVPLGLPGVGGGAGAEGEGAEGEGAEGESGDAESGGEDLVASTDAAIEADRNATVAASGFSDVGDSESSSALFGDAAPTSSDVQGESVTTDSDSSNTEEYNTFSDDSTGMPGMDDSTSFSTDTSDFGDDISSTEQFDDFQQDETSFSTDLGGDDSGGDDGEGGSGLLDSLWDIFFDDE